MVPTDRYLDALAQMHPQHVCSLLATFHRVKPSSIIESVRVDTWHDFVHLARLMGLGIAYASREGLVIVKPLGKVLYLDLECKEHFLNTGELAKAKNLTIYEAIHLEPDSDDGIDVHDVFIAPDFQNLLDLVRLYLLKRFHSRDSQIDRRLGKLLGYPKCCVDNYTSFGPLRPGTTFIRGSSSWEWTRKCP